MAIPISYNVRNVRARWRVTLLAVSGIALVVAVFAMLMSMSEGFAMALRATGSDQNAMVVQRGSASELTSGVPIDQRNMIVAHELVARGPDGVPLASSEVVVVTNKAKADGQPTNVTIRGISLKGIEVRGGIQIVRGRLFAQGLNEMIVGDKIAGRIPGLEVGQTLRQQGRDFAIVGVFASRGGAFESEIWGDQEVIAQAFERQGGANSLTVRLTDPTRVKAFDAWIRSNPQMQLHALSEKKYYEDQAGPLAKILRILATSVAIIMGIGAVFGAMNTMYAIVAARTREIGTLRALGFSRRAILFSFVLESVTLALIGGLIGCLLAVPMNGYSTGTGQTQSFSEIAFAFRITPPIVGIAVAFAVVMGLIGGLLPAFRAARLPITSALREA